MAGLLVSWRIAAMIILVLAAISKMRFPEETTRNVRRLFGIAHATSSASLAWGLAGTELTVAYFLVSARGTFLWAVDLCVILLFTLFSLITYLGHRRHLPCGCFGPSLPIQSPLAVLPDASIAVVGLIAALLTATRTSERSAFANASAMPGPLVAGLALAAAYFGLRYCVQHVPAPANANANEHAELLRIGRKVSQSRTETQDQELAPVDRSPTLSRRALLKRTGILAVGAGFGKSLLLPFGSTARAATLNSIRQRIERKTETLLTADELTATIAGIQTNPLLTSLDHKLADAGFALDWSAVIGARLTYHIQSDIGRSVIAYSIVAVPSAESAYSGLMWIDDILVTDAEGPKTVPAAGMAWIRNSYYIVTEDRATSGTKDLSLFPVPHAASPDLPTSPGCLFALLGCAAAIILLADCGPAAVACFVAGSSAFFSTCGAYAENCANCPKCS